MAQGNGKPHLPDPPRTHPTIYIVEDDEAVRTSLAMLVRTLGYAAEEFPSADSFLAYCERWVPSGCLLVDLKMSPLSGAGLLEALNARGMGLASIAMTAHDDPRLDRRALRAGAVMVLHKPFAEQALVESLKKALSSCTECCGPPH